MIVAVDILHIRTFFQTGTAVMAFNLIKGLTKYTKEEYILLLWEGHANFADECIGESLPKIEVPLSFQERSRIKINFCPDFLRRQLENLKVDIVLSTCFTKESYIFPRRFHQIGVVHDMQPFKIELANGHIIYTLYNLFYSVLYHRLLENVVSISNYVSKDIRKYSWRRSTVIYNSVNSFSNKEIQIDCLDETPYILDVNSFEKYKNTERLIWAFYKMKNEIPHNLYLKGYGCDHKRYKELQGLLASLEIEDRVILDVSNRSNEEMNYLYNHADLFVSPSTMEGFGLTPIEAALHGIPIIVSNIETLVEVTDNKVKTFNPRSIDSIYNTILSVIRNPPSKEELISLADYFRTKYSLKRQIRDYYALMCNKLKKIEKP